jgi:hypothetical protein
MNYLPEKTIKYKTYVKTALVEALRPVFSNHIDQKLQPTKVSIDFPKERQAFPSVIVRFYEKEIKNAGVGHEEHFLDANNKSWKFKHYFYTGDIELVVYALSSLDRDLISDTLVQTLAMGELADYTNRFFARIYPSNSEAVPDSAGHFININADKISGFGETQTAVPWDSEDDLVYSISYRVEVFGEFYSLPQDMPYEFVSQVFTYPYIGGVETPPVGLEDESSWENASG